MERRILGVFATAILTSALAAPAFAADVPDPVLGQMRVKVGDLNLRKDDGAQVAFKRIRTATHAFCGWEPGSRRLAAQAEAQKCDARMTYLAVRKLDAPLVTAAYERSTARPPIVFARR
jgi:UrcA family protein